VGGLFGPAFLPASSAGWELGGELEEEEEEEVNGGWWWQGVNLAWFLVFLGDGRVGRARACVSWLQAAETTGTGRQQRPSRRGTARLGTVPVPACLRYIRVDFAGSRWAVPLRGQMQRRGIGIGIHRSVRGGWPLPA